MADSSGYREAMAASPPGNRRRLEEAAFALYAEHGYAATTAAAIAARAGLTERTFFRHFADKREVVFGNEPALTRALVAAVHEAPSADSGRAAATAGIDALVAALNPRREELRRRERIVADVPELQERELGKLASWTAALRGALEARGEAQEGAALIAEVWVAVLRVAAQRWLADGETQGLPQIVEQTFAELRAFGAD